MKTINLIIIILIMTITASFHTKAAPPDFNFSFEQEKDGNPIGWKSFGSSAYSMYLDSTTVKDGKFSAVIEYKEGTPNSKRCEFVLPDNYAGKQITLSGFIKTENVTEGFAGLWIRFDPEIAAQYTRITGTTEWTRYEIKLPMNPMETERIVIGGLLVGKGKMFLDNLAVTIDGKDIAEASIFEKPLAKKDKAFDNGSAIVFPPLNDQLIANLELLGKLWGFLKYHHPEVGKGNYNWDYELFRMLPTYLKTQDNNDRDNVLLNWINRYGDIPTNTTIEETPSDVFLKPDLSWVENYNVNDKLKKKIQEIYLNRHQGEHYYINLGLLVAGNPECLNEARYSQMRYPDAGFRLLALYRYWNIIQYFFPSKYMTDKNWGIVLKEYIPKFISAKNELEYQLTTIQIIGDINDTHATLIGGDKIREFRGNNYAPFRVQFIEKKLVVTDYYNPELKESSFPEVGDIITHINGESVESVVEKVKTYYPASNEAARLRDISPNLLRSNSNTMDIQYLSAGQTEQKKLSLYDRSRLNIYDHFKVNKSEKYYTLLDGNIGYVTLAAIKNKDVPAIKESFKNTKGIIIDIRNYPLVPVIDTLVPYFVSKPTPFVKFTVGNINNPGEFISVPGEIISPSDQTYQGKLVVLVNEFTQSNGEYTAMALRAGNNTTIIGSTTAGADGNIAFIHLPGGLATAFSALGIYYPDGKETQRVGIIPDVKVEPTISGIKQGTDEVLEKAMEIIRNN